MHLRRLNRFQRYFRTKSKTFRSFISELIYINNLAHVLLQSVLVCVCDLSNDLYIPQMKRYEYNPTNYAALPGNVQLCNRTDSLTLNRRRN